MMITLRMLSVLALALAACEPAPIATQPPAVEAESEPEVPPEPPKAGLRLVGSEGSWYVTGLSDDAVVAIEQSQLFTVIQPIPGSLGDTKAIAVMRAVGPAHGHSVEVARQCLAPGVELAVDAGVELLRAGTARKVGPCLAKVVETGMSERGEDYVVLNVGSGLGVRPGHQYRLLGEAVTEDGPRPLGLDTKNDGICQIPEDPMHLQETTAVCVITTWPQGKRELKNSYAAWMPAEER